MSDVVLSARDVGARYRRREVFHDLWFELCANQALGVIGPNGAGKTTLLRIIAGLLPASAGEMRVRGLEPGRAAARVNVGYFAGDFTLPGAVRACDWGSLATGDVLTAERRRIRTLSRGTRQLLGLRTVLSRPHLGLVVLDEPWEALDVDGSRWLSRTLDAKRDRGAAIVLSSHRLHDLAGVCDKYLFLTGAVPTLVRAHEIARSGLVSADQLIVAFDRARDHATTAIALTDGQPGAVKTVDE
jgi:ABC-type multidrug transport system ATPase subunit